MLTFKILFKMRKLKTLKLKKEVIKKLEDNPMKHLVGGGNFCPGGNKWTNCADGTCPSTYYVC